MKTTRVPNLLAAAALVCALAFPSARAAETTPAEARAIAKDAYIFSYPPRCNTSAMYCRRLMRSQKEYVGGFGRYRHFPLCELPPAKAD